MTKEEFLEILEMIEGAYPHFVLTDKLVNVWMSFLGKFPRDIFYKVVSEYIMENPKPPAISDFYGRCEKISGFRSRSREHE